MTPEQIVRSGMSAIESHDWQKFGSLLTDDFAFIGPFPQPLNKEQAIGAHQALVEAFPDWKFNADNWSVDGDKVSCVAHITGTHKGTLNPPIPGMGAIPATGKKIANAPEPITFVVRGDKLAVLDATPVEGGGFPGILAQLGVKMPH